jgi:hypothetical protein
MAGIIKVNQYQDFNGNTLFTSDGNGNLTTMKTNYPAFQATYSGDYIASFPDNTDTKLTLDSETFDTDSAYDPSTNYRFTVPVAGKYYFYGQLYNYSSNNTNIQSKIKLFKNGSEISENQVRKGSSGINNIADALNLTFVNNASVNDYYELYANINVSSGTDNRIYKPIFGAYRIGS